MRLSKSYRTTMAGLPYQQLASGDDFNAMVMRIAQQRVANRPERIKPKAIKRRPKPFPSLTEPRHRARERIRLHGHPKKLK